MVQYIIMKIINIKIIYICRKIDMTLRFFVISDMIFVSYLDFVINRGRPSFIFCFSLEI